MSLSLDSLPEPDGSENLAIIYEEFMSSYCGYTDSNPNESVEVRENRITTSGIIHILTEKDWNDLSDKGRMAVRMQPFYKFVAREYDAGKWRIFWRFGVRYLCRTLTHEETVRLCNLITGM